MSESKSGAAVVTLALAVLTAYFTIATYSPPTVSSRPVLDEGSAPPAMVGDQFIPARLWQDPLDLEKRFNPKDPRTHPRNLLRQAENKIQNAGGNGAAGKVQVMAIMVEGQPYPEDKEVRRRMRYALQRAMFDNQYEPEDRNNLGVITLPWLAKEKLLNGPTTWLIERQEATNRASSAGIVSWTNDLVSVSLQSPATETNNLPIPYAWFQPNDAQKPPVLVLWLREEYFADSPLRRIAFLLNRLFFSGSPDHFKSFDVIGPRSSNTLSEFLNDLGNDNCQQIEMNWIHQKLRIFSCQSTVPFQFLKGFKSTNGYPSNLFNLIEKDDKLASLIVSELSNRGLYLRMSGSKRTNDVDQVLLIHESDTAYGRTLAQVFREALTVAYNEGNTTQVRLAAPNVISIPYLRGVDGTLPKAMNDAVPADPLGPKSQTRMEKAEGDHQLDYIKRVALELRQNNADDIFVGVARPIKAVGILGSDVYDKLLIIRVLRQIFPDSVFFTTDLDRRFTHREENLSARNLVIASAFSTTLTNNGAPVPFRDSYQASLYHACATALSQEPVTITPPPASLYEVARTRILSLSSTNTVDPRAIPWILSNLREHRSVLNRAALVLATISALLCTLYFYGFHEHIPIQVEDSNRRLIREQRVIRKLKPRFKAENGLKWNHCSQRIIFYSTVCLAIMVIISAVLCVWAAGHPWEEPYADLLFFEGVTVWPTEWIRLLIIAFCWCSIIWAFCSYRSSLYRALSDYRVNMDVLRSEDLKHFKEVGFYECCSISAWTATPRVVIPNWALQLQLRGMGRHRLARTALFSVLLILFCVAVLYLGGFPDRPLRGTITGGLDTFISLMLGISLVALISYTVDVIRLSSRLIARLGDGKTDWPEEFLKEEAQKTGLNQEHISGWIDVQFVAEYTARIHVVTYLPFVAIALTGLSMSNLFDRWPWPASLKAVFGAYALCAAICSWSIRRAANKVKEQALDELNTLRLSHSAASDRFATLIERIQRNEGGAYNRWWADPAIVGLMIPPGSAGAFSIIKNFFLS